MVELGRNKMQCRGEDDVEQGNLRELLATATTTKRECEDGDEEGRVE